ncbi:Uncharacterised protein [Mycobacteroides abscessus subsp. abscessus]|nr:Uncharacterised protein [Mycobacteroides abscessus subsp. abscessus]SKU70755.1 Uncharacterised protein [Mycobacteroides abscessus subsp. abscessus]
MDTDEVLLTLHTRGQPRDGQGGGVGAKERVGLDDVFDLLEHLVLELGVLENGLDHEVDTGQVGRVGSRVNSCEEFAGLFLGGLAPRKSLLFKLFGVTLALLSRLQRNILEHDVVTGLGRDVGDTGAHHARAQHTDLLDVLLGDAVRT